jgi:N-acetylmuramoyl-L-alanine amidase
MPKVHIVEQGDTLLRLGETYGLTPATIWNHGDNADLVSRRKDMNELLPGDHVVIPDVRKRVEKGPTDVRHRFRRKGVPARLIVQVLYAGRPVAGASYTLALEESVRRGTTGPDGVVNEVVSPLAAKGVLLVVPDDGSDIPTITFDVRVGSLDPLNSNTGFAKRLWNLGFWRDAESSEKALARALHDFQLAFGLAVTGTPDQATVDLLEKLHDAPATWRAYEPVQSQQ